MIHDVKIMFMDMIKVSWPMVLISAVVLVSLRIVYLIKNNKKMVLYEELFMLFFVIYILCLFQVVTFQDVGWSGSNFIPFKEIMRYDVGSKMFLRNIFGNILLFLPYGFFASYFLKLRKLLPILILVLIASFAVEATQLIIGRVFDVDDILLNVVGGMIGFYIYHVLDLIEDRLPDYLKKEWVLNVLAILLFVGLGCVLFI